ncbi:MAG TPA: ATP-binding cassette domain-containing protein [Candidatus Dormibacteraeota bacterium]|nr:ATP-binding cassette domain-containing protein [Candidatus Dormibacteraeota bacterium]
MSESVIAVTALTKRYGDLDAVRGIDLDVGPGEIFGFLGPNGAGKSTTISILCTLLRPTTGSARVAGVDVLQNPGAVRARIGLVFQDPSLDDQLTARENLEFHAFLYGVQRAVRRQRIDDALAMVDLTDRASSQVRTFSGGMRRRLEIARGILHYPRVLFLDEPTLGLDPQTRSRIWEYLHALRKREQITIFMTTHYMDEAEFCDRIAIIDRGLIVASGTPLELKRNVGGDVVTITADDPPAVAADVRRAFNLEPVVADGTVRVEVQDSASFLPRLFSELSAPVTAVASRRPSLDDVFLKVTGHAIRDESAGQLDALRQFGAAWRGRRR